MTQDEIIEDGQCKRCADGCPACDARKLPEQEPFMASYEFKQYGYYKDGKGTLKLGNIPATQPPQRTWVGLSPADRGKCLSAGDAHGWIGVMEATEARLKELNT
jgi:hypothetical protein